jgi:ABC-type transporter Mla MlaB component
MQELDFIDAIHILGHKLQLLTDESHVILPIQIRLENDKLGLIEKLLHQNRNMHQQADQLYELLSKLTGSALSVNDEIALRQMVARSAFSHEDYTTSYFYCLEILQFERSHLIDLRSSNEKPIDKIWDLALLIVSEPCFNDPKAKWHLLSQMLSVAGEDLIPTILRLWRSVETQCAWINMKGNEALDTSSIATLVGVLEEDESVLFNVEDVSEHDFYRTAGSSINAYGYECLHNESESFQFANDLSNLETVMSQLVPNTTLGMRMFIMLYNKDVKQLCQLLHGKVRLY